MAIFIYIFFCQRFISKKVILWQFIFEFRKMNGKNGGLDNDAHSFIVLPESSFYTSFPASPHPNPLITRTTTTPLFILSWIGKNVKFSFCSLYAPCFRCFRPRLFDRGEATMVEKVGCDLSNLPFLSLFSCL